MRGLQAEAQRRNVALTTDLDGAPLVRCAPEKIERVLLNLLANALTHTPSDGSVGVIVAAGSDEVRVSVEDSDSGIAPEALRRMFDRFWRGTSLARRGVPGSPWRSRVA